MTSRDVAGYRVKKRDPVCAPYRSWLICGFGPPTSGGIATVMTLGLLERFDLSRLRPGSAVFNARSRRIRRARRRM
ncbi:MAG: gamma-glutamyltransferase [Alphaproteobacteria bacterium]|nr:gamma-glutamyltransferase [Alphaproteobacteria bacterium]